MDFDFSKIPPFIKRIKIDVGLSYSAPQSEVWLSHDSDLFVFGFEPNPECIDSLRAGNITRRPGHDKPLSNENSRRLALIPVALGNVSAPTELDFYTMSKDCGTSSLFKPDTSSLGGIKEIIKVPVHNLSEFFDRFPWDRFAHIEYIKIDAQGADLDILKGAGKYLTDHVVYITAEPENSYYVGCNNSEKEINAFMSTIGFDRVRHSNTSDPTFLNRKFEHLANSIFIYQKG